MRPPLQPNLLQNPAFAGGSTTGWGLQPGWTISTGAPFPPSPGYLAVFTGASFGTIFNETQISCHPGDNIAAQCWALGEPGAIGSASIRILFVDVNLQEIENVYGPLISNNYVWVYTSLVATAPTNAVFAMIGFSVGGYSGSAHWGATQFFGTNLVGEFVNNQVTYKQSLSYYLNLFTSQYRMSSRLNQWQAALMQPIDDLTDCLATMNVSYDIDNAFGAQLDVLGQIIGVSRTVPFQPSGGVSPVLDDATYRTLLYATQAMDLWDGKTASLYPIWQFIFPGVKLVINDNQNMTATIVFSGPALTSIEQDLISHGMIVPRPETVQYNASATATVLFGFDLNTSTIAGFDTGHFA